MKYRAKEGPCLWYGMWPAVIRQRSLSANLRIKPHPNFHSTGHWDPVMFCYSWDSYRYRVSYKLVPNRDKIQLYIQPDFFLQLYTTLPSCRVHSFLVFKSQWDITFWSLREVCLFSFCSKWFWHKALFRSLF